MLLALIILQVLLLESERADVGRSGAKKISEPLGVIHPDFSAACFG